MFTKNTDSIKITVALTSILIISSCAAGDAKFTTLDPAGFFYGFWHGIISFISLIIHLFNENISVYEVNNTGGWYDFGFLLGVTTIWGGGSHASYKSSADKKREKEWEEVGKKVEIKVMRELKEWAADEDSGDDQDWDEIGEKVEKKLKRKIREWAEND